MPDHDLFDASAPFRGQSVRAVLAFSGKTWTEAGDDAIVRLMGGPVEDMPVPFMGSPVLVDRKADVAIAQMPAIILYLGKIAQVATAIGSGPDLVPVDGAAKAAI